MKRLILSLNSFFEVVATTKKSQAAQMVLHPGEKTGGPQNNHKNADQWMYIIEGSGKAIVESKKVSLVKGNLLLIEAGENHEIENTGNIPLKTFSIYSSPEY